MSVAGTIYNGGEKMGKNKHPFNATQIKNGRIVKLRKDGRIKADLGPYYANHNKVKPKKVVQ
jgi:hypothetical protein